MKRLFVLIALYSVSTAVLANTFFYCPEYIECTRAGDNTSCKRVGGNIKGRLAEEGFIQKGIYQFQSAWALDNELRQSIGGDNEEGGTRTCTYKNIQGKHARYIRLWTGMDYRAVISNENSWRLEGWNADCFNSDSTKCPIIKFNSNHK